MICVQNKIQSVSGGYNASECKVSGLRFCFLLFCRVSHVCFYFYNSATLFMHASTLMLTHNYRVLKSLFSNEVTLVLTQMSKPHKRWAN